MAARVGAKPRIGVVRAGQAVDDARWAAYARRYLSEMRCPEARRLIALLAALSKQAGFSIGCLPEGSELHAALERVFTRCDAAPSSDRV